MICQFWEKDPKPIFVKLHILVYAKILNIAILGLLKVARVPVKSLLYAYTISKTKSKKSIFRPLFHNRGVSKLRNAIWTKNFTLSQRNELALLEFKPNSWISKLDWRQNAKITLFPKVLDKNNITWGKFQIKIWETNPLILF